MKPLESHAVDGADADFDRLLLQVHTIGKDVLSVHAAEVDRDARFPRESFDALRRAKLLSAYVPKEFGGMGLEGSVKLGYRNELAAIEDPVARKAKFDEMVAAAYAHGKAMARGAYPALDDVIDPADTRKWIVGGLKALPPIPPRTEKKLRWVDSW